MLKYKGYIGHIVFDDEARIFHGEVLGIRDIITFQGKSVDELEQAFHDSVDDYLDFCKEREEKPEKPFSGSFIFRTSPELHQKLYQEAKAAGMSLNGYVNHILKTTVSQK